MTIQQRIKSCVTWCNLLSSLFIEDEWISFFTLIAFFLCVSSRCVWESREIGFLMSVAAGRARWREGRGSHMLPFFLIFLNWGFEETFQQHRLICRWQKHLKIIMSVLDNATDFNHGEAQEDCAYTKSHHRNEAIKYLF